MSVILEELERLFRENVSSALKTMEIASKLKREYREQEAFDQKDLKVELYHLSQGIKRRLKLENEIEAGKSNDYDKWLRFKELELNRYNQILNFYKEDILPKDLFEFIKCCEDEVSKNLNEIMMANYQQISKILCNK